MSKYSFDLQNDQVYEDGGRHTAMAHREYRIQTCPHIPQTEFQIHYIAGIYIPAMCMVNSNSTTRSRIISGNKPTQ